MIRNKEKLLELKTGRLRCGEVVKLLEAREKKLMSSHPRTSLAAFAVIALSLSACKQQTPAPASETANATRVTAEDAYIYGYPLVLMDVTRAKMTNVPHALGMGAPINQFASVKTFPDATFTDVVSPNADTLYTQAWLDLSKEPLVLSVPDTHGRYYLMPMLDAWTNVFASPGKRTTGTGKGNFAITGPGWTGSLPVGVKEIKSPTDMVWVIGRTQANGKADFPAVNAIQAQYKLTPLSEWGKPYTPVNAFWSITMYNAKQSFVANPLNRFAIGDRDKLKFNPDGSLDIYLQHDSPGKDKESNWLPADAGSFNVALRMYWPKESALSGAWTPPPIKKVG
jgi:hypothetical protein